jgi:SAM-dependent methyltransferase
VLDLGCAFGFGTRLLVGQYDAYGHDLACGFIERARRALPQARFTVGQADRVPYPDAFFDGLLLLDVLEHVPDDPAVIAETGRLVRPGGQLILSIPNRGLLAPLDSLNLYQRLLGAEAPAPTDDPSWPSVRYHRHYSLSDVERLLAPYFRITSSHISGLGLAELVNLPLLLTLRGVRPLNRWYDLAQYLYFGAYMVEDLIPAGPWGYHLMVSAERLGGGEPSPRRKREDGL